LKLISWNCQGAFRKKVNAILTCNSDIIVVPESEHPEKIDFHTSKQPNDMFWYGDNVHKGIGIYSFSDYKFELLPSFNPEFRYILPFRVTGHGNSFLLFAIWAMSNKVNYNARYIGQIWLAINYYTQLMGESVLLVGDFNSNKIWDTKKRVGNHSDVVQMLTTNKIQSVYHKHFNIEQGKEIHPTFFLHRNQKKPYHIDYCFASDHIIEKVQKVEIGNFENWIEFSDHSPLIIDIAF